MENESMPQCVTVGGGRLRASYVNAPTPARHVAGAGDRAAMKPRAGLRRRADLRIIAPGMAAHATLRGLGNSPLSGLRLLTVTIGSADRTTFRHREGHRLIVLGYALGGAVVVVVSILAYLALWRD